MPELCSLGQDDWNRLCETIRRGYCILVLGPDAAVDPDNEDAPPLGDQLAQLLAKEYADNRESIPANIDLPLAAELFLHNTQKDRFDLEIKTDNFLQPFDGKSSLIHRNLATLPFRLIITTSHDRLIETALQAEELGKQSRTALYNFKDPARHSVKLSADPSQPVVYKLFGDRSELESMVLSESELLEFIVKVARGSSTLPDDIAAQLADPQKAFLFIGFGFHRWYSRILLHLLRAHGGGARSIALEQQTVYDISSWKQTALYFDSSHAISFQNQGWADFTTKLKNQYHDYDRQHRQHPPAVPDKTAPTIFLCHDNDDAASVAKLELKLRASGLNTWLDKQRLRGGQDWDRRIERVIGESVNYVLVLESPRLLSKTKGYVFKEIDAALEQQKSNRPGFSFLIPATLEACNGLAELNSFQRADASTDEGIARLCEDIKDDWQKRERLKSTGEPA